jgi:predicted transcriptional regulator
MKEVQIKVFDDQDFINADLFKSLGINRNASQVLVYLLHNDKANSRDIEIATGLKQPQVSRGLKFLRSMLIVDSIVISEKSAKGRKQNIHSLYVDINHLINMIDNQIYTEYRNKVMTLNNLSDFYGVVHE